MCVCVCFMLLNSLPLDFYAVKDVPNLPLPQYDRALVIFFYFNLFPSPFYCVTNFNAVFFFCYEKKRESSKYYAIVRAQNSWLIQWAEYSCALCVWCYYCSVRRQEARRFMCKCVWVFCCFSYWSENAERFQCLSFCSTTNCQSNNLIKTVRLESRETM